MLINYDVEKIRNILQDFYNATGINLNLLKDDFSNLCENPRVHNSYCRTVQCSTEGMKACDMSDKALLEKCKNSKKAEVHVCHAGLINVAIPIIIEEQIAGYIILGQMKREKEFSAVEKYIKNLPVNTSQMEEYYSELSVFEHDRICSVVNLAVMLAEYILLQNMIKPGYDDITEKTVAFINENLENNLTIELITKNVNISKSVLYKIFHKNFGCTVNGYITSRRLEKSVHMLLNTDFSIEEISSKTGFSSAAYYTANFKKQKGITPLKFRKLNN